MSKTDPLYVRIQPTLLKLLDENSKGVTTYYLREKLRDTCSGPTVRRALRDLASRDVVECLRYSGPDGNHLWWLGSARREHERHLRESLERKRYERKLQWRYSKEILAILRPQNVNMRFWNPTAEDYSDPILVLTGDNIERMYELLSRRLR